MGGPLIVVPVSAVASWGGCTESGLMAGDATAPDDYDRACAVDDLAGVIPVNTNGAQALVLSVEPAASCYLPQHRAFLRWLAAETEAGLSAAADAALGDPATVWEECGTWDSDGLAVLMDSAEAGADLNVEYPDARAACPGVGPPARRPLDGPRHADLGGRGELRRPGPAPACRVLTNNTSGSGRQRRAQPERGPRRRAGMRRSR
ncbi:Imm21 family immunity protein [Streptomyces sp. NPDC005012]|uniref:Imm21 family immunity protein n=1 Tax=unclassified Streptomyces TaxID=2593676 RepID=UPI0033BF9AA8